MAELGFLITRSPHASPGARSFYLLARAALEAGHPVQAFFYMDGVYQCLKAHQSGASGQEGPATWMETLLGLGAVLTASNRCLRSRGLDAEGLMAGVRVGTLEDLARLSARSDRVVCL